MSVGTLCSWVVGNPRLIPCRELNADVICVNRVALALMIAHRLLVSSFAERSATSRKKRC